MKEINLRYRCGKPNIGFKGAMSLWLSIWTVMINYNDHNFILDYKFFRKIELCCFKNN